MSFGNFLIKQVVEELKQELPRIEQFATLSPVPGFRRWLDRQADEPEPPLDAEIDRRAGGSRDLGDGRQPAPRSRHR